MNAAATELGTTWPSLRKAFTRHGLGMPARNPEAVRQRAVEAARQRSGRLATPSLDPVFVALNHSEIPVRARSGGELADRAHRRHQDRQQRRQRHQAGRGERSSRPKPEREMVADAR